MYPVGIPLLYSFILWTNRESLNPRVRADAELLERGEATARLASSAHSRGGSHATSESKRCGDTDDEAEGGGSDSRKEALSGTGERQETQEVLNVEERLRMRQSNPDLAPSMFLWKDFGRNNWWKKYIPVTSQNTGLIKRGRSAP